MRLFCGLNPKPPRPWIPVLLLATGVLVMLPHGRLHDYGTVPWFLGGAAFMVAGFFLALRRPAMPPVWFWLTAAGLRIVLLFQAPGDDIYRYVWEGRILGTGWNPYLHAPDAASLAPLRDAVLWPAVQHKTFTAIYPPAAEWLFVLLAAVAASPLFFKSVFVLADLATTLLLVRKFGQDRALIHAWNPLVLVCIAGGGHYDSVFVLALVLGWLAWRDRQPVRSAAWWGTAVALKWFALPLLAWACWQGTREAWRTRHPAPLGPLLLAGSLPFILFWTLTGFWSGEWTLHLLPSKFSQYARSAEFLPALVGLVWEESRFHNHWFLIPLAAAWLAVILRARDPGSAAEWFFFSAFLLTPMLHAWYFTWMVPFAVVSRNRGTLFLAASGFVYFLLYHHIESPGGAWKLSIAETALLWTPFLLGFLWSAWGRTRTSSP